MGRKKRITSFATIEEKNAYIEKLKNRRDKFKRMSIIPELIELLTDLNISDDYIQSHALGSIDWMLGAIAGFFGVALPGGPPTLNLILILLSFVLIPMGTARIFGSHYRGPLVTIFSIIAFPFLLVGLELMKIDVKRNYKKKIKKIEKIPLSLTKVDTLSDKLIFNTNAISHEMEVINDTVSSLKYLRERIFNVGNPEYKKHFIQKLDKILDELLNVDKSKIDYCKEIDKAIKEVKEEVDSYYRSRSHIDWRIPEWTILKHTPDGKIIWGSHEVEKTIKKTL